MSSYNPGACCRGVIIKGTSIKFFIETFFPLFANKCFSGSAMISGSFKTARVSIEAECIGGSMKPTSITPLIKSTTWISVVASLRFSDTSGYSRRNSRNTLGSKL